MCSDECDSMINLLDSSGQAIVDLNSQFGTTLSLMDTTNLGNVTTMMPLGQQHNHQQQQHSAAVPNRYVCVCLCFLNYFLQIL
jgi:hypothetical protein